MTGRHDGRTAPSASRAGPGLWVLAVVLFGVGDVATTGVGLSAGLHELNPLARHAFLVHGFTAMLALKLLCLGCCGVVWMWAPRPYRVGVPLGLVVLGSAVTVWNVVVVTVLILS